MTTAIYCSFICPYAKALDEALSMARVCRTKQGIYCKKLKKIVEKSSICTLNKRKIWKG